MEIELEFLCDEIYSLLDQYHITEEEVPDLWSMIEKFAGKVLRKYNRAQKVEVETDGEA